MQSIQLARAAADLALAAAILTPPCVALVVIAAVCENTAAGRRFAVWAVQTIAKGGR